MITYRIDLPSIIKSLEGINIVIEANKPYAMMVENIQTRVISIIENITNRIPLEIVKDRVLTLIELVRDLIAGKVTSIK
jgi:uncharacterized FlaG/YvyC family protein